MLAKFPEHQNTGFGCLHSPNHRSKNAWIKEVGQTKGSKIEKKRKESEFKRMIKYKIRV
jgi:hypothetical protein